MNGVTTAWTMALSVAFTGVLVEWIARRRDPSRLFFVAMGRELTAADEARRTRLRWVNGIATLAGVVLCLLPVGEPLALLGGVGAPLVSSLWLTAEVIGAARSADLEKVPGRYAVMLDDPPTALDLVSAPLQVANVLAVLLPCALFAWVLSRLPAVVPAQWNSAGEVSRMANPAELWMLAGIMIFDLVLLWGVVWGVAKERWAMPEDGAARYLELAVERRTLMVRMIEWIMLAINAGMGIIWLGIAFGALPGWGGLVGPSIGVSLALMLVGTLGPMVVYLPRLTKVQDQLRAIAGTEVLGTRASGWRWGGLVYYAPEDPALFVPKRVGIGQTFNFARPAAWVILIAILVLPLLITFGWIALAS